MSIKILFINSIDVTKPLERRYPSLGLGYLAASLRHRFPDIVCKIIDDELEKEIQDFKPDMVAISSVSQNYNRALSYARTAKRYNLTVLCGGVHISMLPQSLSKDMDAGIIGEGEVTICELVNIFLKKNRFDTDDLKGIKGIIYRDGAGRIAVTEPRSFIEPLDSLPFPARDLVRPRADTYMFTSRGCPYRCAFCASSRFWNRVRFFSPEYVVREIKTLAGKFGVKHINFYDDLFILDTSRVERIVRLLEAESLLGKVTFECSVRANLVTDPVVGLLKKMGVTAIGVGFESGCARTLEYLNKQGVGTEDNERSAAIIRRHGIPIFGSFIIGAPHETREDALETFRFIKRAGMAGFNVYVLTPFPGTPVWDYALKRGFVSESMDWDILDVDFERNHEKAIILSETMTREELYRLFMQFKSYEKKIHRPWWISSLMRRLHGK